MQRKVLKEGIGLKLICPEFLYSFPVKIAIAQLDTYCEHILFIQCSIQDGVALFVLGQGSFSSSKEQQIGEPVHLPGVKTIAFPKLCLFSDLLSWHLVAVHCLEDLIYPLPTFRNFTHQSLTSAWSTINTLGFIVKQSCFCISSLFGWFWSSYSLPRGWNFQCFHKETRCFPSSVSCKD